MSKPLSNDFIDNLVKKASQPRTSGKRKADDPDVPTNRDILVWFRLYQSYALCSNPNCPDDRPRKVEEGTAMCALVHGQAVCRKCYLAGYLLPPGA